MRSHHVSQAFNGGTIALVRTGDKIIADAVKFTLNVDLSEEEFKATSTYVLKATTPTNPQGGGQKAHNFHILDFAPSIFHRLRELWAVSDAEYVASMCKVD